MLYAERLRQRNLEKLGTALIAATAIKEKATIGEIITLNGLSGTWKVLANDLIYFSKGHMTRRYSLENPATGEKLSYESEFPKKLFRKRLS